MRVLTYMCNVCETRTQRPITHLYQKKGLPLIAMSSTSKINKSKKTGINISFKTSYKTMKFKVQEKSRIKTRRMVSWIKA